MPQLVSANDLMTTVKNISGAGMFFSFIGSHGVYLAANASYSTRGDLLAKVTPLNKKRHFDALVRALETKLLSLVSSPSVYLFDAYNSVTRKIALYHDQLGIVDPSWESSGSTTFVDGH